MHLSFLAKTLSSLWAFLCFLAITSAAPLLGRQNTTSCRALPGDSTWPTAADWAQLNQTVQGGLITASPLATPCYTSGFNSSTCEAVQDQWTALDPYLAHPVEVMSPYWVNTSCSAFPDRSDGSCTLGNLASYAVNVTDAAAVVASVKFARQHNIRLIVKNTGHDFLGRSSGKGSLALWTTHLKGVQLLSNYSSPNYSGTALKVGAGIQNGELYNVSNAYGLRVVGGSCPTVGYGGGYISAGGHGPLASAYGLASDQTLEFEVVTAAGDQITVSPQQNADLYWAMSGGGAGNWAIILSVTVKAFKDGPIAGSTFGFIADSPAQHWAAISAWMKHLLVLDRIPGFSSLWGFNNNTFLLEYATLPDGTQESMEQALAPFWNELTELNISLFLNETKANPSFLTHYDTFATQAYSTNNSLGGRLIPRQTVEQDLPTLITLFQDAVNSSTLSGSFVSGIANNVTHARVGNTPGSNAVNPAWRDSLFTMNFGIPLAEDATWSSMDYGQAWLNDRQDDYRAVMPDGGAYINEATYDNAEYQTDYYGSTYEELLSIKTKYDPDGFFWSWAAVGSETWRPDADGRLCRQ